VLKRVGHAADFDPQTEVRCPLPEGRALGRGGKTGSDQLVDCFALPDMPFLAELLYGGGDIIVQ
jgi:hypothetical protein